MFRKDRMGDNKEQRDENKKRRDQARADFAKKKVQQTGNLLKKGYTAGQDTKTNADAPSSQLQGNREINRGERN